jgi:hypothetical protein
MSIFQESKQFNDSLRKDRTQHLIRRLGGVGKRDMSPDEVVRELGARFKVTISRRTLLRWEHEGLIPVPTRRGAGKGHGWITDYPDETVSEAYATHELCHDPKYRVSVDAIAEARGFALQVDDNEGFFFIDQVMDHPFTTALAEKWLEFRERARERPSAWAQEQKRWK